MYEHAKSFLPERLRGMFTTKRYTNPRLPYLTFYALVLFSYRRLVLVEKASSLSFSQKKSINLSIYPFINL